MESTTSSYPAGTEWRHRQENQREEGGIGHARWAGSLGLMKPAVDTEHFSSWHLELPGNITAFLVLSFGHLSEGALPSRKEQAGDPDKAGGTRVRKERNERHRLDSSSHAHQLSSQNLARLCAPLERGLPWFLSHSRAGFSSISAHSMHQPPNSLPVNSFVVRNSQSSFLLLGIKEL